jgi:hypothetical protein
LLGKSDSITGSRFGYVIALFGFEVDAQLAADWMLVQRGGHDAPGTLEAPEDAETLRARRFAERGSGEADGHAAIVPIRVDPISRVDPTGPLYLMRPEKQGDDLTMTRKLPAYVGAPARIAAGLRELGRQWAHASERPRVAVDMRVHWDELIHEWSYSDLPLIVRKSGGVRGAAVVHESGREIVLADNSPAQWAFVQAYAGLLYRVADIRELLAKDAIPFAYATKSAEKAQMKFRCTLNPKDNVNKCGWKLCHIAGIGLSTRIPLVKLPLSDLITHFSLFMAPSNHFVVPLGWAGLGEVEEFISEIRQAEVSEGTR